MTNLVYALFIGVVMGWLLQRVRASSPALITANLRLENLTIIKFMALTIAVGSVLVYLLSTYHPMHIDVKPLYLLGVAVGGIIFGVGFAVGGYCPGTCVVAAGEGRRDAWFTILGGIGGALLFTLLYNVIEPVFIRPMNYGKVTLANVLHISPLIAAVLLAAVFLTVIRMLPNVRGRATPRV